MGVTYSVKSTWIFHLIQKCLGKKVNHWHLSSRYLPQKNKNTCKQSNPRYFWWGREEKEGVALLLSST